MKKRLFASFLLLFLVVPGFSSAATVAELQAQLQVLMAQLSALQSRQTTPVAPQSGATLSSCPNLTRNLSRGSRGDDVAQLQRFLTSQNLLTSDNVTGFFGTMTESALKQWQKRNDIVSSGTAATTGYGAVGPRTRVAITNACNQIIQTPATSSTSTTPPATYTSPAVGTGNTDPNQPAQVATTPVTIITSISSPATLAQYWNGKAEWKLVNNLSSAQMISKGRPAGYGEGSQIVVGADGIWYLFHRHVYNTLDTSSMNALWGANSEAERKLCAFSGSIIGTDIRKSTDKGKTWSDPRPIVWPAKGLPWECMGGDGGAYYDKASSTWYYLFQCMALNSERTTAGKWNGCLITFHGADPVIGPNILWDHAVNPVVIQSGTLLNKLCAVPNSACARLHPVAPSALKDIYDEGTFDIFDRKFVDGQWWWYVTMHGFDNILGFRALVKTADFVNWKIGSDASDLPNDFIGSAYTANGWSETWQGWTDGAGGQVLSEPWPIGTGAARILKEDDYYYQVVEVSDKNLVCVPGQKWDIGILRTNNLANATWEQYPLGNPVFKSSNLAPGLPCPLSYANVFRDVDGTTYFEMHVHSNNPNEDGIYLYQLVSK